MSSMLSQCKVHMFDQGRLRSRSYIKVKHCMTVPRVRSISLEPGFTNNYAQMLSMMSRCAVRNFNQSRLKVKVLVQG